ncbi:MAG: chromosomal replication initiator protein DnaA [Phycisphaerae bacterium]|nr:chromosomal replication initiator protein DnaA [Phycisphaerae bacterium]
MESPVTEKLCAIREKVADRIGANRYRTWFGGSTDFQLDGGNLAVTVPNEFVGNWISTNYMPHLIEATREVVGTEPRIAVHVSEERSRTRGTEPPSSVPPPASPHLHVGRPRQKEPSPTLRGELESFVVGPSNELAYSVVSAVVRAPGEAFKHLVLHGGCGLGKTHLLHGICNGVSRARPDLEWRYLSGEEFTNEFVYAVKSGRIDLFRGRFRNVDLLVIDDIHFLANKKATQEEFLHTFNAIDASGKAVVLSSDRHPRGIATLSEPLINRLIAAMVVEVNRPDFATRREILRRRAAAMLCELPEDILDFLAQRITRNVRELEGALYKLAAFASLTKEPLGLDLARRTVEDYVTAARPPEAAEIARMVAAHFGVTAEALRSNSRDRSVTQARSVAMFLIRKHTRLSFPEIGRLMGNKQHSTVIMAARRVQEALDRRGTLAWKTPSGLREVAAQDLLDELEQRLACGDND